MKRRIILAAAGGLIALTALASFFCLGKESAPPFVQMTVKGVRLDPLAQSPVVILSDKEEKKIVPIWIGLLEANAIEKELNNATSERPMTHDLLYSILGQVEARVKEIKIVDLKDHTYYATLFLTLNKKEIEMDARPSDAIIIALKSKAPIFVAAKILTDQGISVTQETTAPDHHGIRVQELTPDLASQFDFREGKGVLVSEVISGSTAEGAGIRAGDIISKINSKETGSIEEFESAIEAETTAKSLRLSIFRDGKRKEISLAIKP